MPENLPPISATNLAGSLDLSFGIGGKAEIPIGNTMSGSTSAIASASSVVIDANNRIVVVGSGRNGSNLDIVLARYTSTGSLDLSFGMGGKVIFPIGSGDDYGRNVAIDGSGRIVVVGFSDNNDNYYNFVLTRYTNTGVLDETFGINGKVIAPIALGENWATSMAIDASDRIILAGSTNDINSDFVLTRYTSTGSLDGTFGTGGKVFSSIGIGAGNGYANSVQLDASGRIVVAGTASNGSNLDFALARYTNAGATDPSFGTGGKVLSPIGAGNDYGSNVAIDVSGKIIVAGQVAPNFSDRSNFALARYTSAGILDSSFGIGGTLIAPNVRDMDDSVALDANGRIIASSVAIDASGRIVIVGYYLNDLGSGSSRNVDVALARYTSAGVLDSSFGTGGIVISPIIDGGGLGNDLVIDANDRIVVVGYSADGSNSGFTVARYNGGPNNFTFKADTFTRNATTQAVENFYVDQATQLQARRNLIYGSSFGALAGQTIKLGSDWVIAAIADFNRDGIDDILLHNPLGDAVELWTLGTNAQVAAIQSIVGQDGNTLKTGNTDWKVVGFADSDRDGILDIVWRNQQSDEVAFWFMANDGKTVKTYDYLRNSDGTITKTNNSLWQIAAVADFDRDGNIDLLFRLPELNQTAIVRTSGKTLVDAQYITANVDVNLQIRGIADNNGDSIPEVYWQSPDKRKVLVQAVKFQAGKWLADDFALANPIVPLTIAA
jgi:uncharacterized delta-60 repeat protein